MNAPRDYLCKLHYNRHHKAWTVHYRGQCLIAKEVRLEVESRTVLKPDKKSNPRGWVECRGVAVFADQSTLRILPAKSLERLEGA